jgi:hypothetical protein
LLKASFDLARPIGGSFPTTGADNPVIDTGYAVLALLEAISRCLLIAKQAYPMFGALHENFGGFRLFSGP